MREVLSTPQMETAFKKEKKSMSEADKDGWNVEIIS